MTSIDFPVLKLINDSRSTYGLRHQDFGRYKSHCATKVQHLRKSVGLVQTSGRAKKYTKKDISEKNATSDRHLQILLFDSERAWAHSQLLKSTLNAPTTSSKAKHHLSRRLSRALLRSDHLLSIVNSLPQISMVQKGQTTAYYLYMKGSLAFEQAKNKEGLESLSLLYELLGTLSKTSETAQEEALANEMMDEIEPMLRFCAYSLRMDISNGVGEVAKSITSSEGEKSIKGWNELIEELEKRGKAKGDKGKTVELRWRGEEIPIRNVELVSVISKVQEALRSLENDKVPKKVRDDGVKKGGRKEVMGARRMGTYDKALFVLSEGEETARQLMEDNQIALSRSSSTRFEASSSSLSLAHSYIVYQHLSVRIKRDLLLIEDTSSKLSLKIQKIQTKASTYLSKNGTVDSKVTELKVNKQKAKVYPSLIRIYENVVLGLEKMRDLELVEKDVELAGIVEARIAFVRASRCLYLSKTYHLVSQFPSSLSLNSRAKLYSRESASSYLPPSLDEEEEDLDFAGDLLQLSTLDFSELNQELESDYVQISKDWYNATSGQFGSLEEQVEGLQLEEGKGKGKGKEKKKPTFYDVAFNYVAGFDLDAIAVRAGLQEAVLVSKVTQVAVQEEEEEEEEEEEDVEMVNQAPVVKKGGWGYLFGR